MPFTTSVITTLRRADTVETRELDSYTDTVGDLQSESWQRITLAAGESEVSVDFGDVVNAKVVWIRSDSPVQVLIDGVFTKPVNHTMTFVNGMINALALTNLDANNQAEVRVYLAS